MARGVVFAFGVVGVSAIAVAQGCTSTGTSAVPACTLGAACSNTELCMGGIAGCTSNCQCLNGTWQAPCPHDAPQSGSACAPEGTECGYVTQAIACGGSVDCNCKSGAWTCGPTCVSPPTAADAGSLCVAAGGQCVSFGATCTTIVGPVQACDSDTPGGAFCCALAGSCTAKASNYNQSCKVDSDCVAVHEGDLCNLCALNCTNAAINVSAQAQYMSDLVNTPAAISAQRLACTGDCAVQFGPCCVGGTCQMGGQCPAPGVLVRDAAADTGADAAMVDAATDSPTDAAADASASDAADAAE
jgi:hypothetical protein